MSTTPRHRLTNALLVAALRGGARLYVGWAGVRAVVVGWWTRSGLRPVFVLARIVWLCARSSWRTRHRRKSARP
jgi:hypothetical protein